MNVNQIAFCTSTALAAGTCAAAIAAATTATTVATVAYTILAVGLGAVSIASVTAWIDRTSTDASAYFSNMKNHAGYAIAGTAQFVSQTLLQALIQGVGDGIYRLISKKISGEPSRGAFIG